MRKADCEITEFSAEESWPLGVGREPHWGRGVRRS